MAGVTPDKDPAKKHVPAVPRDASTLIVLRPNPERFEVFLVKRHGKSGFMASAHVFPGGVIEDDDAAVENYCHGRSPLECAEALGEADASLAFRAHIAAIRETFEEAAMLLCTPSSVHEDERTQARDQLNDSTLNFGDVLERFSTRLDLSELHPFARWVTPTVERRRYDTHFFLTVAEEHESGVHDQREVTAGDWMNPSRAIEAAHAGEIILPPPTLHTLLLLAECDSIEEALQLCPASPPRIQPVFSKEAFPTLALPGDALHPISDAALPGPTRFELRDGRWQAP